MRHNLKFRSAQEKINIWLDLCDFTFRLMACRLSADALRRKIKMMRQSHLKTDYLIWSKLARSK